MPARNLRDKKLKMNQMHKTSKATNYTGITELQFPVHKKEFHHLPEVRGKNVTSQNMKPHDHKYGFQKSLHPSSPGTQAKKLA